MSGARVSRTRAVLILASTTLLGWGAWWIFRPRPTLDHALALAEARQLENADEHIRRYLRDNPESDAGHLLFAQIQIDLAELHKGEPSWPDPQYATESLAHLRARPSF